MVGLSKLHLAGGDYHASLMVNRLLVAVGEGKGEGEGEGEGEGAGER